METTTRAQATTTASLGEYHSLRSMVERRIYDSVAMTTPDTLRNALQHASMGGKRIRPALTLISTQAVGGNPADSLDAAVAVEFLHASSLVHDDIMDASDLRRGKPAVHTLFGPSMAILAGDMLLALAFRSIGRVPLPFRDRSFDILTEAFVATCEGQGYDIADWGFPVADCGSQHTMMVEKKTARLIEAAATLGGLLGEAPGELIEALGGFGYNIGMAYQAKDDLLDASASETVTGKSVDVDNRNGRTTFATLAERGESEIIGIVNSYTMKAFACLNLLPQTRHRENLKALAETLVGRSM